MKNELAKSALVALGFALIFFLSCTDYSDLEKFPSKEKMPQGYSSSSGEEFLSSSSEITVYSSFAESSSSVEESSSSFIEGSSSSSLEMEVSSSSSSHSSSSAEVVSSSSSSSFGQSSSSLATVSSSSFVQSSSSSVTVSSSSSVQSSSSVSEGCEGITFNPNNKFCYDGAVYDKCDGMEYIPSSQICTNGVATPARCGGVGYNPITQGCCGSAIYSRATQKCTGGVVETICGSGWYNAVTHFCTRSESNPQIVLLCGGKGYDTRAKFCSGGTIYDKCGGIDYNPSTHFCTRSASNPQIVLLCGGKGYDTRTKFCDSRDGKTYKYVTIGTQTWMAENLNYNANDSKCYLDDDSYCDTYGHLYNWATAMSLPASCNSSSCSVGTKHQGICPSGWHIPNDDEWATLINFVGIPGTENNAGEYLKAKDGWHDCGHSGSGKIYSCEDTHGFSALPGGEFSYSGGKFDYVGYNGNWWSSAQYEANYAYKRSMYHEKKNVERYLNLKSNYLLSVRCLQN
jgi:uncharacterized protein (TIGR02145 family)